LIVTIYIVTIARGEQRDLDEGIKSSYNDKKSANTVAPSEGS